MEIQGKLISRGKVEKGTSKQGKEWQKLTIVLETDGQYPKNVAIEVIKQQVIDVVSKLKQNENLICSVNVESREYNGRWFTSVTAWNVKVATAVETVRSTTPQAEEPEQTFDNLPF